MAKYSDYLPANARVTLEFGRHEKVHFGYPIKWTYKKAVWKRAFIAIYNFWILIHIYGIYAIVFLSSPVWIGYIAYYSFFPKTEVIVYTSEISATTMAFGFLQGCVILAYFIGIPMLYTWWLAKDQKKMSEILPKLSYWSSKLMGNEKNVVFKPKDVFKNKVVIQNFSNVYLNYKCRGDFNKYLKRIKIVEIPFSYKKSRFPLPLPQKYYKIKNDFEWMAIFEFSKPVNEGRLTVNFI